MRRRHVVALAVALVATAAAGVVAWRGARPGDQPAAQSPAHTWPPRRPVQGGAAPETADLVVYNAATNALALFDVDSRAWAGLAVSGEVKGRAVYGSQVPLDTNIRDVTTVDGCVALVLADHSLSVLNPSSRTVAFALPLGGNDLGVGPTSEFFVDGVFSDAAGLGVFGSFNRPELDTYEGFVIRVGPAGNVESRRLYSAPVQDVSVAGGQHGVVLISDGSVFDSVTGAAVTTLNKSYSASWLSVGVGGRGDVWASAATSMYDAPDPAGTNFVRTSRGITVPIPYAAEPNNIDVFGDTALVTLAGIDSVWLIRSDGTVVSKTPVGDYPYSAVRDGDVLYVASANADELTVLSARDGSVLWAVPGGPAPNRVAMLRPAGLAGALIPACRSGAMS